MPPTSFRPGPVIWSATARPTPPPPGRRGALPAAHRGLPAAPASRSLPACRGLRRLRASCRRSSRGLLGAAPGMTRPALPAARRRAAARAPRAPCRWPAGPLWFAEAAEHRRGAPPRLVPAGDVPPDVLARLTAPRRAGLRPHARPAADHGRAQRHAGQLLRRRPAPAPARTPWRGPRRWPAAGADILDIGGEFHPPRRRAGARGGGDCARVVPVIAALRAGGRRRADLDRHPQRRRRPRRLRRRRRPLQRRLGAHPRSGQPRRSPPDGRLAGLPDARAGRPEDHAGRARLRRRAARGRGLPRGARRGGRGGAASRARASSSIRASASARRWRTTSR